MALTRLKIWVSGEILTHTDLNAEFDNFINNAASLFSPWTSNIDAGGFRLITLGTGSLGSPTLQPTGDTNTGIWFSAADTVDISAGGARAAQFGASALISASPEDSRTTTVDVLAELRSTTSSAPASGIGTGLLFSAESADENPSNLGRLDFSFDDVGAGTEDSVFDILLRTAGATEAARYRFQATGAFLATITHALTAARTITVPDENVTIGNGRKSTVLQSADFTTTSSTLVDVTGLSVTITTIARRVLLIYAGSANNTSAAGSCEGTFAVDGTDVGGTSGLNTTFFTEANKARGFNMIYVTDALTAGSHTFKVRIMVGSSGTGTATLIGNPSQGQFIVMEI